MRCTFTTILAVLTITVTANAQWNLHDEHGDTLPTQWPPAVGTYDPYSITIWFNQNSINQNYICSYWSRVSHSTKYKQPNRDIQSLPSGVMPIDTSVITDTALVNALINLGADSMQQYTNFSPCEDTLSYTLFGDTIRTPQFWNCFKIFLHYPVADSAAQLLDILYGGASINYAELNTVINYDGPYVPVNPPNDPVWLAANAQIDFFPSFPPLPTQQYPYSEDIVGAWYVHNPSIQTGFRTVKVGVVDDGFDYNHVDFGGGIGCAACSFVNGQEYQNGAMVAQPPSNGGAHGTPTAGLIGAINNNNLDVSSIAGILWNPATNSPVPNTGVSLYAMKSDGATNSDVDAVTAAVANTSGGKGFGVNVLNTSWGGGYDETLRKAFDYAYRMGVVCVASKGNDNANELHFPADFEYSKMIAVGAEQATWDPSRKAYQPTRCSSTLSNGTTSPCTSNFGFGIDIMAQGDNNGSLANNPLGILLNQTLQSGGGTRWFSQTSAASPQVAGTAGLMISELNSALGNFHPNIQRPFYPEDVQGLLCATAEDMVFWDPWIGTGAMDTTGYDAVTGYGLLQGGAALQGMQLPYQLVHYTTTGGNIPANPIQTLTPFIVEAPSDGTAPLLPPSTLAIVYTADQYPVTTLYNLPTTWNPGPVSPNAAAWGLGEKSTGWNGSQPLDQNGNTVTYQTGYTRVEGKGVAAAANTFNPKDIRDIDFGAPLTSVALETFCYRVWLNKAKTVPAVNPNYPTGDATYPQSNWFPCPPDKVVYNLSVWGVPQVSVVQESSNNLIPSRNAITVHSEELGASTGQSVIVRYTMEHPETATITIYDILGREITHTSPSVWGSGEQTVILNMSSASDGAYITVVRSATAVGSDKFIFIK